MREPGGSAAEGGVVTKRPPRRGLDEAYGVGGDDWRQLGARWGARLDHTQSIQVLNELWPPQEPVFRGFLVAHCLPPRQLILPHTRALEAISIHVRQRRRVARVSRHEPPVRHIRAHAWGDFIHILPDPAETESAAARRAFQRRLLRLGVVTLINLEAPADGRTDRQTD